MSFQGGLAEVKNVTTAMFELGGMPSTKNQGGTRVKLLRSPLLWVALLALLSPDLARAQQPISPPLRPGFPVTLSGSGTVTSIATGDLDGNGSEEIIVGTRGRKIYALRANGTILWGPVGTTAEIDSTPAIADLDGDGLNDIVVGVGSMVDPTGTARVVALKGTTGAVLWSYTPVLTLPPANLVMSSPAIGDLDGDGTLEVVVGAAADGSVHVFRSNGTTFPGWPKFVRDTIISSPALADLDNDGKLEIIIGIDTHQEGNPTNDMNLCNPFIWPPMTPNGGALVVFRSDGSLFPGFPVCVDEIIQSSPAVGDIDGDGIPEIVVGTGRYYSLTSSPLVGRYVNAWHINGSPVVGWPRPVGGTVFSSPALADLDGDNKLDVIVFSEDLRLYAFRGDGSTIFATQPKSFFGTTANNSGSPVVADVNGDGQLEVMIPVNTDIAVLNRNGVQLTDDGSHTGKQSFYTETTVTAPIITDLDHNGVLDVVAGSGTPFPSASDGKVYVWNPANVVGPLPWPKFHHDVRNTGWQRPASSALVVTPTSQDFGSVLVGSAFDRTFTVQNTGTDTLTGSASTTTPFSIVSGGSYNLGTGAQQSVTVRFSPTSAAAFTSDVTFTGGGGAIRQVTGTGVSSDAAKLGVFRNGTWFLDRNGNGTWDGCGVDGCIFGWGMAGDLPVAGRW